MDIILTNSIIMIGIGAAMVVALIVLAFILRLRYKRKKFNILTIKKCGGVDMTDNERMFLIKNKHVTRTIKRRIKTFSLKPLKRKIVDFFNKFNPSWYKKQIEKLEIEAKRARQSASQAQGALRDLRKAHEETAGPKVPKKEKKEETSLEKKAGVELASISSFA